MLAAERESILSNRVLPPFSSVPDLPSGADLQSAVYETTPLVLQTIRNVCGEGNFDRALGEYARAYRFEHPTREDFFATLSKYLTPACSQLARTLLTESPDYDAYIDGIEAQKSPKGFENTVWLAARGRAQIPQRVELKFEDGHRESQIVTLGASARITADGPSRIESAWIDPDFAVVIDRDRTNNARSVVAVIDQSVRRPAVSARAPARLTQMIGTLVSILLRGVGP
jgi:aminopeptidase N